MPATKHNKFKVIYIYLIFTMIITSANGTPLKAATVIDHTCTDITQIPESAINQAKTTLHIAYGHTSHGSQITTGMSALVDFMNGRGYTHDLYRYNSGGTDDALDLRDQPFSGANDLGNPDRTAWASATRTYLDNHTDVNVIIWSWCGQAGSASEAEINTYLNLMNSLEQDYPDVRFVYMTGHLDGSGTGGNLYLRNQQIRDYCAQNDKILYDFADIESYDPDGATNYMTLFANDNCDYDSDGNGSRDRNWAADWQNSHTQNIDWYQCSAAHSQALNGNRKAYAAWHLWARLAGWDACLPAPTHLTATADSETTQITLSWNAYTETADHLILQRQMDSDPWNNTYATLSSGATTYTDGDLSPGSYRYRLAAYLDDDGSGGQCTSAVSNTAAGQIINSEAPVVEPPVAEPPVVENATIRLEDGGNGEVNDAFLDPDNPDTNFGGTNYLGTFQHFIIKFNLPQDITGKQIDSAKVAFYTWNLSNWQDSQYLELYPVLNDWEENTVTWNTAMDTTPWLAPGGDLDENELLGQIAIDQNNWDHTFTSEVDITALVQQWADGTTANHGLMLINASLTSIGLKASEYSSGKRPYLEITYSEKSTTTDAGQEEDTITENSDTSDNGTDNAGGSTGNNIDTVNNAAGSESSGSDSITDIPSNSTSSDGNCFISDLRF